MIIGFIGNVGSGKTLSMTREVLKYYAEGWNVISNYQLYFPHQLVDWEDLFYLAEKQVDMSNVVLAIDEMQILLDSRSGMSEENKLITFWLNQVRKMNIVLLFTTQYEHQVDKRLRSGINIRVFCDGIYVTKLIEGVREKFFFCQNDKLNGEVVRREVFVGDTFFNLYETKQVIKFMSRKKQLRGKELSKLILVNNNGVEDDDVGEG